MIICSECKGPNVEMAVWYDPNLETVTDDYGSWGPTDTKWCRDCGKHVLLIDTSIRHLTPDSNREQQV